MMHAMKTGIRYLGVSSGSLIAFFINKYHCQIFFIYKSFSFALGIFIKIYQFRPQLM